MKHLKIPILMILLIMSFIGLFICADEATEWVKPLIMISGIFAFGFTSYAISTALRENT